MQCNDIKSPNPEQTSNLLHWADEEGNYLLRREVNCNSVTESSPLSTSHSAALSIEHFSMFVEDFSLGFMTVPFCKFFIDVDVAITILIYIL